jgi:multidrug efflux pump
LGIVIVGGVMFSLLLTLFIVPAVYTYLSTRKKANALDEMEPTSLTV